MQRVTMKVNGKDGLHARPAAELVQLCKKTKSDIKLEKDGVIVSGKSIIGIMSLGISCGDEVTVIAEGDDEVDTIVLIKELLDKE